MPIAVKPLRGHIIRVSSRTLLTDWLNLDSKEFLRRHPEVLRGLRKYRKEGDRVKHAIANVRNALALAWEAKDLRERDFYLFQARQIYHKAEFVAEIGAIAEDMQIVSPPEEDEPFHKAIFHLYDTRAIPRLSKCALKDCPAPYFIRRKPKKQPYCSTACHGIVLRECKARYEREGRKRN